MTWDAIIGLEIHVQLNTRSKLFSPAPNRFGDAPNTNITAACTAQPGSLPVLNKEAVRKAVQFGLAINAKINPISCFDRKSYFYPDLPKGYQITQYEKPLISGGFVKINTEGKEKIIQIHHTHLEEDTGILKHFPKFTGIDFNRAGVPLLEITTEPCIRSAKEASALAFAIRTILIYLDASECNMEEGSFRIDANVSVKKRDESVHRPKVEIKNLNSFSFLELAIEKEIGRQIEIYEKHPNRPLEELIPPTTARWDHEKRKIVLMRKKLSANDYRYFPEPDLAPVVLTDDYMDWVRHTLPELPQNRHRRYTIDLGLSPQIATFLVNHKPLSDTFDEAMKTSINPRLLSNWICCEFPRKIILSIPPSHISKLVRMIDEEKITGPIAKKIAGEMAQSPKLDPEIIAESNPDYRPMQTEEEIEPLINQAIAAHPQPVLDYQTGRKKAFAFLVGRIMQLSNGKASPKIIHELLLKKFTS